MYGFKQILWRMAKTKGYIRMPTVDLKYESETVENRIKTSFHGKSICWELYHTLDLTEDKKNRLEKISHYKMAQWLHEEIANIDVFFKWKRTLNSCARWNFRNLRSIILISMFTSYKENYMAEKWYSWENWLSQIKNEDLTELQVSRRITIINAPADKLSSDQRIISQIRNALDHTHYFLEWNIIYIRSPQTGFEAKVPLDFLCDFITLVQKKGRREPWYGIYTDDPSIYYPNDYKFDDIKNKVHYYISVNSDKEHLPHARIRDAYIEFAQLHSDWMTTEERETFRNMTKEHFDDYKRLSKLHKNWFTEKDRTQKEIKFTDKLENLAKIYFNENGKSKKRKRHIIDYKNLKYLWMTLFYPFEDFFWNALDFLMWKIENDDYRFHCDDFVEEMGIHTTANRSAAFRRGETDEEIGELFSLERILLDKKLKNWQSILRQRNECKTFAIKYFLDQGFVPDIEFVKNEDGENQINRILFKCGDSLEIDGGNIIEVCMALSGYYFLGCQLAETFPNWLKIQFIESVYVNELISLKSDNVPWLVWSGIKKPNDKFTNRDHVRNALVHNNYTMIHWVDEIVLRDWYNKKTDTWEREETINLPQLYEETYKEMAYNMDNEPDLEIMLDKNSLSN